MGSRRWGGGLGLAVVMLGLAARQTFVVVRVEGSSMLPTYADGDRLLAVRTRLGRPVRPGDVVVVTAPAPGGSADGPTETLVKRVRSVEAGRFGRVHVTGDNSPSYDSTVFGPLPPDAVIGRVIRVVSTT